MKSDIMKSFTNEILAVLMDGFALKQTVTERCFSGQRNESEANLALDAPKVDSEERNVIVPTRGFSGAAAPSGAMIWCVWWWDGGSRPCAEKGAQHQELWGGVLQL